MESNIVLIKNKNTNKVLEVKLENLVPLLVTGDYIVIDYDYKKEVDVILDNVADKQDVETIITTIEENSGGGGSSGGLDRLSIINFLNNYFEEKTLINNVEAKAYQLNKENLTNLDIENTFEILNNKSLNDLEDFRNGLVNDNLNSIVLHELTYNVILKTPAINFTEKQSNKAKIKYEFVFDRGFIEDLEVKILRDSVLYDTRIIPAGNTEYTLELIVSDNGTNENYNISFELNGVVHENTFTTQVLTNTGIEYGSKAYIESVFTEATLFNKLDLFGEPIQYKVGDFDYVFKKDPLGTNHSVDIYKYRTTGTIKKAYTVNNIINYGKDTNVTLKLDQRGYLKLKCLNTVTNGKYFICSEENVEGFVAIVIQGTLYSNVGIINNELWATPNNICISKVTSTGISGSYNVNGIFNRVTNKDTEVLKLWDTSKITNMSNLFYAIVNINANLNSWDVSNVIDMSSMFFSATSFNQPLNNWDTSKVTNINNMFSYATSFNQPLNNWNTSIVTSMNAMFYNATSFDQPLNNWDTSNVNNMSNMFYNATSFNQPLNNWDTSNVINMGSMFYGATSFNQPLNNWDTSNVKYMTQMFYGATSFNQPLNNWVVSKVIDMSSMFSSATSFNNSLDGWNTSIVASMNAMFYKAISFDQPLNNWDTSNVNNMSSMFDGATSFDQPLNNWDTSKVTNMIYMFNAATSFDQPLNNWDTSNVNNMNNMFSGATSFNQPLNNWNTSKVYYMNHMFNGATSFNQPLNNWNTSKVIEMSYMFNGATSFNQPLDYFNLFMCNSAAYMFQNATSFKQNLSTWCVPKLSSRPYNFNTGSQITILPVWGTCPVKP